MGFSVHSTTNHWGQWEIIESFSQYFQVIYYANELACEQPCCIVQKERFILFVSINSIASKVIWSLENLLCPTGKSLAEFVANPVKR